MKMLKKILVAAMAGVMCLSLCACSDLVISGRSGNIFDTAGGYSFNYEDGLNYTILEGEKEIADSVESIDIDWLSGDVDIEYHNEDTVKIIEKSKKELSDDEKARYILDGTNLKIRFCKNGISLNFNAKDLTIVLPEGKKLNGFEFDATSANLGFDVLKTGYFEADLTSGNIVGAKLICDGDVSVDRTSGNFIISEEMKAGCFESDSTSGGTNLFNASVEDRIEIDGTSCNATLRLAKMCDVSFAATSGDIYIDIPQDASFTARHNSTSGKLNMGFAALLNNNKYVVGDGEYKIDINVTSGNSEIKPY